MNRRFYNNISDVEVFIAKTGINDSTISNALQHCVYALMDAQLWLKIKVFFPMVGGSAHTTKFDLIKKNISQFDISWRGNPVFSQEGVNGGSGHKAYGYIPYRVIEHTELGNEGYTICVGTNDEDISSDPIIFGGFTNAPTRNYSLIDIRQTQLSVRINNESISTSNTSKVGIYSVSRRGNNLNGIKNKNEIINTATSGGLQSGRLAVLNVMNGEVPYAQGYSTGRVQSLIIHEGLTSAEMFALQNIINAFEESVGRKTW